MSAKKLVVLELGAVTGRQLGEKIVCQGSVTRCRKCSAEPAAEKLFMRAYHAERLQKLRHFLGATLPIATRLLAAQILAKASQFDFDTCQTLVKRYRLSEPGASASGGVERPKF